MLLAKKKNGHVWNPAANRKYFYSDGSPVVERAVYHPHKSTRYISETTIHKDGSSNDDSRNLPELYTKRSECCGCTACAAACPVGAIEMEPDEEGFDYPVVNSDKCLRCGKCLKSCVFKKRYLRDCPQ